MPTLTRFTIERTTRLYCDHVYILHGLSKAITNDMECIALSFGIRLALPTTFHSQTNGQKKWVDHVIEDMLRLYGEFIFYDYIFI